MFACEFFLVEAHMIYCIPKGICAIIHPQMCKISNLLWVMYMIKYSVTVSALKKFMTSSKKWMHVGRLSYNITVFCVYNVVYTMCRYTHLVQKKKSWTKYINHLFECN